MYDSQYHRNEANRFFSEYIAAQAKIDIIERDALKAAGGWEKAQAHALTDPNSDAAFVYKNLCKNRATFTMLVTMHSNMAIMLATETRVVPIQREATSET